MLTSSSCVQIFYIYHSTVRNSFKSKTKNEKNKNKTTVIDQAGCSHKVEKCDGFSFSSVLSRCSLFFYIFTVFLSLFFLFLFFSFEIDIIPLDTGWWLQSSHQGGIQTLSISRSNSCIWQVPVRHPNAFQLSVKTPPCLLFIADPCPTTSQPIPTNTAPPLQLRSLSHHCSPGLLPHIATSQSGCPRVDSKASKMSHVVCATGVCVSPRCASLTDNVHTSCLRAFVFFVVFVLSSICQVSRDLIIFVPDVIFAR